LPTPDVLQVSTNRFSKYSHINLKIGIPVKEFAKLLIFRSHLYFSTYTNEEMYTVQGCVKSKIIFSNNQRPCLATASVYPPSTRDKLKEEALGSHRGRKRGEGDTREKEED
jgi:hypothetical protein